MSDDATKRVQVRRLEGGRFRSVEDTVTMEEPLEVRVVAYDEARRVAHSVAVTMRTPGHDVELAAGFLFTEGILHGADEIEEIATETADDVELPLLRMRSDDTEPAEKNNVVNVYLKPGVRFEPHLLTRNFYMTSSCGVCGKASLNALKVRGCPPIGSRGPVVGANVIDNLGASLDRSQAVFRETGGLHAAALFDSGGRLLDLREDVGRHNAMDKLIGRRFLDGRVPLAESTVLLSGRASWELMQKALVAGIPIVVAVGAPSSLAVDLAKEFNMTLVGFARGKGFNVYAGEQRVTDRRTRSGASQLDGKLR